MTNQDIIQSFYQQGESDCATIAVIKVAIAKLGINNIFRSTYDETTNSFGINFNNGTNVTVTKKQIEYLNTFSGFKPNFSDGNDIQKEIYDYALFCFSVFVANYAKLNSFSIETAVSNIDKSGSADYWYHYLGFNDDSIEFLTVNAGIRDIDTLANYDLYLLYNKYHAVMATQNQYDEYGHPTNIDSFAGHHSKLFSGKKVWAWRFR